MFNFSLPEFFFHTVWHVMTEQMDEIADAIENLRLVKVAMEAAPPAAISALSKRRQELTAMVAAAQQSSQPNALSQLRAVSRANAS